MKTPSPATLVCFGCHEPLSPRDARTIRLAPGQNATVCMARGNRTYEGPASTVCTRKAYAVSKLCPGCGQSGYEPGTICNECIAKIDRSNSQTVREFNWYVINAGKMMPYLSHPRDQQEGSTSGLSRLLATVAAGEGRIGTDGRDVGHAYHIPNGNYSTFTGDCSRVELTKEQAAAMRDLGTAIEALMRDQRSAGKREGLSLLMQLANGEVTVSQFEERKARMLNDE